MKNKGMKFLTGSLAILGGVLFFTILSGLMMESCAQDKSSVPKVKSEVRDTLVVDIKDDYPKVLEQINEFKQNVEALEQAIRILNVRIEDQYRHILREEDLEVSKIERLIPDGDKLKIVLKPKKK